jgi:hypothetical protein
MKIEKKIKKQLIEMASKSPEKFFPVEALKKKEFKRYTCKKCGAKFWSTKKKRNLWRPFLYIDL